MQYGGGGGGAVTNLWKYFIKKRYFLNDGFPKCKYFSHSKTVLTQEAFIIQICLLLGHHLLNLIQDAYKGFLQLFKHRKIHMVVQKKELSHKF